MSFKILPVKGKIIIKGKKKIRGGFSIAKFTEFSGLRLLNLIYYVRFTMNGDMPLLAGSINGYRYHQIST